ncbi:hypothetical protein [Sphingobium indicum]|uniref:hypothetical protein n=1 Tax=Sphingobium indicum TaxID=332055 RepID=UPI001E365099|nr:hypothetical protein [Sphingobium indicum]
MQRTIEIADFELPRGAISIADLMAMEQARWEHIRTEINLRRRADPTSPLARCRLCEGGIFIRAQLTAAGTYPVYAHFSGSPLDCPWYDGENLKPDDARAAQYNGHQESALHRWLCQTVEQVAKVDPRCSHSAIDTYLRPSIAERGRWPDVFLEMGALGAFALEIQLSKPFAPEIAARHLHYDREGVSLIWIFRDLASGAGADLPQGFRDVITMQRGNAFVFDADALAASIARNTLILNCYLETERGGYLKPRLVALDDLDTRSERSVFLEDRRTGRLLEYCTNGRAKWWEPFKQADPHKVRYPFNETCFGPAWDSIRAFVPELSEWKRHYREEKLENGEHHFLEIAAILFSIANSARLGRDRLHITRIQGEGALINMLNSKIGSARFGCYAVLAETMLSNTAAHDRLDRDSLRATFEQAKASHAQIEPRHPVWVAAKRLFPEVLDGPLRAELHDLGKLPQWAIGGPTPA